MDIKKVDIVLIEDNPADVELTLRALEQHNLANSVKVLNNGEDALDYLSTQCAQGGAGCPLLILLDLKLPKIDGLEVLQRIRSNKDTSLLPVVVLTSSAEERDKIESYKLRVNSYIVKPVVFDKFARVVAHIGLYWALVNKPPC